MAQLPEVREADAPPHITAIYADIKESAALPQVNLIFRYFATKPGVLEWIWATLRPLYCSSELAAAAQTLTNSIERPASSPLAVVLSGDDLLACKVVLESYNNGNPQNLIALTALVRALSPSAHSSSTSAATSLTPRTAASDVAAIPFPALPRRGDLSPEAMARVEHMAARHASAPGVIPSMYLHLALWPGALEAADTYLQPIIETPDWAALIAWVIEQAGETATQLVPGIELAPNAPEAPVLDEVAGTIEAFINQTIPELTAVGRLLAIE